uniref:Uncharacterized protein n=1 Tax=Arundo donax TaxID=35708 RepID=A0A0A8YWI8_ARUDO
MSILYVYVCDDLMALVLSLVLSSC